MMSPRITVLLSLYGDAPYLSAFLESLDRQEHRDFRLLVRIDEPGGEKRIPLVRAYPFASFAADSGVHRGCAGSYGSLLEEAAEDSDYLLTADQDDVWDPDKIGTELNIMREAEREYGRETPILVHTDLRVADRDLRVLAPSFMRFQALSPERTGLKDLMIQNNVTGCTVMINRSLARRVRIPPEAICHDWYLALTAAAFGRIVYLDRATVSYRQHESNVYGAVPRHAQFRKLFSPGRLHESLRATQRQAGAFLARHEEELAPDQKAVLSAWHDCLEEPDKWKRLRTVFGHRLRKNDLLRTAGMWWAV